MSKDDYEDEYKDTSEILLFLDIDGVLNSHRRTITNYTSIDENCCGILNVLLDMYPNMKIVISSAWRYMILNGDMTLKGFEYMLLKSGLKCRNRVIGCTGKDPTGETSHFDAETWHQAGLTYRAVQIENYLSLAGFPKYIVLDDLPLAISNLIQTDGDRGISHDDVKKAINLLTKGNDGYL